MNHVCFAWTEGEKIIVYILTFMYPVLWRLEALREDRHRDVATVPT